MSTNIKPPNYLIAFDFDKTIAETFKTAPGVMDVNQAFSIAIKDIFGTNGLEIYNSQGGLRNRATSELMHDMLMADRQRLIHAGIDYLRLNKSDLQSVVPEGKGASLDWETQHPESVMGEILVRRKLQHLLPQISRTNDGKIWPEPTKGFTNMWESLQGLKRQGIGIDLAVVSSGHDLFIQKVFSLWKLSQADILVTEDDIRGMDLPKRMDLRVKPGTLPLSLAYKSWRRRNDLTDGSSYVDAPFIHADRIIYFGDDPVKDGGLARSQGIIFGNFDHDKVGTSALRREGDFQFSDWQVVSDNLNTNIQLMMEGKSLRQVFSPENMTKEGIRYYGKER